MNSLGPNAKNGPHSTGKMPANAVVVGMNWLRKGGVLSPRRLSIDVTCVFCAVGLKYYTHTPINGPKMLMRPLLTFGLLVILDVNFSVLLSIFIGPESDHWECLSLTNSLTNSLRNV